MNSHQQPEIDSGKTDYVTSTPWSNHSHRLQDGFFTEKQQVRFMCSFGGKILPRPHDNQLRYVGGDTRIVAVNRHATFASLYSKLVKLSGIADICIKYQLPNEDLDALITVTTDEDVDNMMEEYDRLAQLHSKLPRLRLFLFSTDADSRPSSISSLLDGSIRRENWFFDALNGGSGSGPSSISGLERGKSEVSSILSEVPDYLLGLENSDDPRRESKPNPRSHLHETISNSDPGSPAAVVSSQFCSISSTLPPPYVSSLPDLPPVKTKPSNLVPVLEPKDAGDQSIPQQLPPGYTDNQMWHYVQDPRYPNQAVQPIRFYYVPAPVSSGSIPVQTVPMRAPYVQAFPPPPPHIPVGYRQPVTSASQVYGGEVKPMPAMDPYGMIGRVAADGVSQTMYYGVRNGGVTPSYHGMVRPEGVEFQGNGNEVNESRVSQSS